MNAHSPWRQRTALIATFATLGVIGAGCLDSDLAGKLIDEGRKHGGYVEPDRYEPDDNFSLRRATISLDSLQHHTISPASDKDYMFQASLPVVGRRAVTIRTENGLRLLVTVWGASPLPLWVNTSGRTIKVELFNTNDRVQLIPKATYQLDNGKWIHAPAGVHNLKLLAKSGLFYKKVGSATNASGALAFEAAGRGLRAQRLPDTRQEVGRQEVRGTRTFSVVMSPEYSSLVVLAQGADGREGEYSVEIR